jgi:hypothetical protein
MITKQLVYTNSEWYYCRKMIISDEQGYLFKSNQGE